MEKENLCKSIHVEFRNFESWEIAILDEYIKSALVLAKMEIKELESEEI